MASSSFQLQQTLEPAYCNSKSNNSGAMNPVCNDDSDSNTDHCRQEWNKSLDLLNAPKQGVSLREWEGSFPNISVWEDILEELIGDKALEEIRRKHLAGCKTNEDFTHVLPAPVVRLEDELPYDSGASSGFQTSHSIAKRGFSSLVLMGCTNCHLYVMVSEMEPKCRICQGTMLLDSFRGNAAPRSRL